MYQDFEPSKAFELIDQDQDGQIDEHDIVGFLKSNYLKINKEEAAAIIKEFDADMDGSMSYKEFCSFCLPATNNAIRRLCEMRKNSYSYRKDKPLDQNSIKLLTRHFELELRFIKIREQIKFELLKSEDFVKAKIFQILS
jgi:EF-hand domain pair